MITLKNQNGNLGAGDGLQQDISTRANLSVAIGEGANKINIGQGNVVQGYGAGINLTKSSYNTIAGYRSAESATSSDYNVLLGPFTGRILIGTENVYAGAYSGEKATRTSRNVGIGAFTFNESENSIGSVGVGYRACARMLTGSYNTAVGTQAAENARSAHFSTMVGYQAGRATFVADGNTYIGAFSGYSNATGNYNVMVGYRCGENLVSGDYSVAIGAGSLANSAGGQSNVAIGFGAATDGGGSLSVIIGAGAAPTASGRGNVVIAADGAPSLTTGGCNIIIGIGADTYTPDTNRSIILGNIDVVGGTRTISIGENIENKQVNSTLIGYSLTSDAANTVMIGNIISIDSVLFMKDPLNIFIKDAVAADASSKFGISNIVYTNTLASPTAPYVVATAAVTTTPIVTVGPTSPASFSLLDSPSILPIRPYVINHGAAIAVATAAPATIAVPMTLANNLGPTYNPLTSNQTFPSTDVLGAPPASLKYTFTYTSNLAPLVNRTVTTNVLGFNTSNTVAPIYFVKRSHIPFLPQNNSNVALVSPIFPPPGPSDSNITIAAPAFLSNIGIDLPVSSTTVAYFVEVPPTFGTVASSTKSIKGTTSNGGFLYTPYPESAFAQTDSVGIRPILNIFDNSSNIYGVPSSNLCIVAVSKPAFSATTCNILFTSPSSSSPNHVLTPTDIIANPPIPTTPLRITAIPSTVKITVTTPTPTPALAPHTYTSNDIAQMNAEEIDSWPDSLLTTCNLQVQAIATTSLATASNAFSPYMSNITQDIITLSNLNPTDPPATLIAQQTTSLAQIYNSPPPAQFTQSFSNAWTSWTSNVSLWPPAAASTTLAADIGHFQDFFTTSNIWAGGSNVQLFKVTLAAPGEAASNAFALLPTFSNIPTFSNVSDAYSIVYHKYYQIPRLFLTYSDIQNKNVTISLTETTSNQYIGSLNFAGGYNPIPLSNIPETLLYAPTQQLTATIPAFPIMPLTPLFAGSTSNADGIQSILPLNGLLWTSNANNNGGAPAQIAFNTSNTYYHTTDPFATSDSARVIIGSSNSQTATHFDITLTRAPGHFNNPITIPAPDQIAIVTATSNVVYRIYQTPFWASNIEIDIQGTTSNITSNVIPIYNPAIGYHIATSNLTTSNYTIGDGPNSNIYFNSSNLIWGLGQTAPTIITYNWTIPSPTSNLSTNQYLRVYTSNYPTFTSNYNIFTSNHVINRHFAQTSNIFLYTENQPLTPITSPSPVPIPIPYSWSVATTTPNLYHQTSNIIRQSNIDVFEPTFQLSRTFMYSWPAPGNPNPVYTKILGPLVVASNIGPVTSWTQSNILSKEIFLILPPKTTSNVPLILDYLASGGQQQLQINAIGSNWLPVPVPAAIIPGYADPITLNMGQYIRIPFSLPETILYPTINIAYLARGALVDPSSNLATTIASSQSANYYRTGPYDTDTILYSASNPATGQSTGLIERTIYLNSDPLRIGIGYNAGLDYIDNHVQPRAFFVARAPAVLPGDITITPTPAPNWTFSPSTFTMAQINDGAVSVVSSTPTPPTTTTNTTLTINTILSPATLPLTSFIYDAYPSQSNALGSSFTILRFGNSNTQNIKSGNLWTNYTPASLALNNPYISITSPPTTGILWSLSNANTFFALNDNSMRFIPFNPDPQAIQNDSFKMRIVTNKTNKTISPEYTVDLKNYFAPFPPSAAADPTQRWPANRTVPLPPLNAGLIADGYAWTTANGSFVVPGSNILYNYLKPLTLASPVPAPAPVPALTDIFVIAPYSRSDPPQIPQNASTSVTLTTDQADRIYFDTILASVSSNLATRDVIFYVTSLPTDGIVYSTIDGTPRPAFTADEVRTRTVAYQNLGSSNTTITDSLVLRISSHPYDLLPTASNITVSINIRPMPSISKNNKQYVWFDEAAIANSTINAFAASNLVLTPPSASAPGTASNCYLNVIAAENGATVSFVNSNVVRAFAFSDPVGFRVAVNPAASNIYAPLRLSLAANRTPPLSGPSGPSDPYVNPLAYYPAYSNLFLVPWTAGINEYVNSNLVSFTETSNQVISYAFDPTAAGYAQLNQRAVSIGFSVAPAQTLVETSSNADFLRTYDFSLTATDLRGSNLLFVDFKKSVVTVTSSNLPPRLITNAAPIPMTTGSAAAANATNSTYTNIMLMNQDNNNAAAVSLYVGYNLTNNRVDNAAFNILAGLGIPPVDFSAIGLISLQINTRAPENFTPAAAFVRPSVIPGGDLSFAFKLQNYGTTLFFNNFFISASTYQIILGQIDSLSDNLETHNVVIGETIQVRGTNNLCIGNNFTTSGKNSIILGNDVGISPSGATSGQVNDIYECIIVGNGSFQNSVVREIISIGNNHMQDLSLSPVADVNAFLTQKPILIGNDISRAQLDYSINIGNVFLRTKVGGERVFIGNNSEQVGVGYTSNQAIPATLGVNGSVYASKYNNFVNGAILCQGVGFSASNLLTPDKVWYTVTSSGADGDRPTFNLASSSADTNVLGVICEVPGTGPTNIANINIIGITYVWVRLPLSGVINRGELLQTAPYGIAEVQSTASITSSTLGKALTNSSEAVETQTIIGETAVRILCKLLC